MSVFTSSNCEQFHQDLWIFMISETLFVTAIHCEIFTSFLNSLSFAKPLKISQDKFSSLLKKNWVVPFPSLINIIILHSTSNNSKMRNCIPSACSSALDWNFMRWPSVKSFCCWRKSMTELCSLILLIMLIRKIFLPNVISSHSRCKVSKVLSKHGE